MTAIELEENLKKLKVKNIYCNLFEEYHSTPKKIREIGLYVKKNNNLWEVSYIERGNAELACVFYDVCDLYEYIFCYFKKISDVDYWFSNLEEQYAQKLIKKIEKFRIPDTEYSFDSGLPKNCLCVVQQAGAWEVYYSNGVKKMTRGIFYQKNAAYDFLFYLVMKKYVNKGKRWW